MNNLHQIRANTDESHLAIIWYLQQYCKAKTRYVNGKYYWFDAYRGWIQYTGRKQGIDGLINIWKDYGGEVPDLSKVVLT